VGKGKNSRLGAVMLFAKIAHRAVTASIAKN
jgi:hypothetical protein